MTVILDQPFQILLELVQEHKLDPWDVDIEKLADMFIRHVQEMEGLDLRVSGRTILSASVLLRMKSDYAINGDNGPRITEEELQDAFDLGLPELGPIALIQRSPRRITLVDLLAVLKEALGETPSIKHVTRRGLEKIMQALSEYDINIEKYLERLYQRITELADGGRIVAFSELLEERTRLAVVRTILLLLFLYAQKKVTLSQEGTFGEIFISVAKPAGG